MTRFSGGCFTTLFAALLASASAPARADGPTPFQRLTSPEPQNWLLPHGTYNSWRYSELEQITPANAKGLKLAFAFPLGGLPGAWNGEHVPLVDDGFMYVTNSLSMVIKLDVRSGTRGAPLWTFDPANSLEVISNTITNRGVALIDNDVIINTSDGRVIALNRDTGEAAWEKRLGVVFAEGFQGQPLAVKDKVMVGNARGDKGTRGWIAALAVSTGAELWRFYTVPGPGEPGHETWPNTDAYKIGGGSIWTIPSYDVDANLLYYGTSNASPAYDPEFRPGDNLYTSSTLAVNADSGKLQWYFQYVPNDGLEYDEVTPNLLVDTMIGGVPRKALAHHSVRNGHFYTLDRTNGAFIAARENAPTVSWTAGIDPKTGKPVEYDPTKSLQSYGGRNASRAGFGNPGCQAASSWGGQAYNPTLNRVYSLIADSCFLRMTAPPAFLGNYNYVFGSLVGNQVRGNLIASKEATGNPALSALQGTLVGPRLTATDVSTGMVVNFAPAATENPNGNPQGGTLATKSGLVFFGHGDGTLSAYDAATMANLWSINVGTPLRSPPISYGVGGKQYIAITGGGTPTGALSQLGDIRGSILWVFTL